eukprot:scaffold188733_cov18-Tisochrysis_lutea.AAC.1
MEVSALKVAFQYLDKKLHHDWPGCGPSAVSAAQSTCVVQQKLETKIYVYKKVSILYRMCAVKLRLLSFLFSPSPTADPDTQVCVLESQWALIAFLYQALVTAGLPDQGAWSPPCRLLTLAFKNRSALLNERQALLLTIAFEKCSGLLNERQPCCLLTLAFKMCTGE